MKEPTYPSELSSADLSLVTGGRAPAAAAQGPITNPWNPGFWTQGWTAGRAAGAQIRAPLSGNVKTGPQYYCMPGSVCHFNVTPAAPQSLKPLK
jgi:hypothetical protein